MLLEDSFDIRLLLFFFHSLQVTDALAKARLEFSNLIDRIDFTKSNQWTGSLRNLGQASCLFLMLHYKNYLQDGLVGVCILGCHI